MATAKVNLPTSTIPKAKGSAVLQTAWHQHPSLNQPLGDARDQPENNSPHFELIDAQSWRDDGISRKAGSGSRHAPAAPMRFPICASVGTSALNGVVLSWQRG